MTVGIYTINGRRIKVETSETRGTYTVLEDGHFLTYIDADGPKNKRTYTVRNNQFTTMKAACLFIVTGYRATPKPPKPVYRYEFRIQTETGYRIAKVDSSSIEGARQRLGTLPKGERVVCVTEIEEVKR